MAAVARLNGEELAALLRLWVEDEEAAGQAIADLDRFGRADTEDRLQDWLSDAPSN